MEQLQQQSRIDQGWTVVEWEYFDGSGSWAYGEHDECIDFAWQFIENGAGRVWINGELGGS